MFSRVFYHALFFICLFPITLYALPSEPRVPEPDVAIAAIGDDSALRAELDGTIFRLTPRNALAFKPERRILLDGSKVEIRVEQGNGEFMTVLARQGDGSFPSWSQGTWVLYRSLSTGERTRIRFFPRSDPYCYLQFRPDGQDRTLLDAIAYEGYVSRSIVLPLDLDRVVIEPLNRVLMPAIDTFPRRYFEPRPEYYTDIRVLSEAIRSRLGALVYADDGALDENGLPVFIESGSPQTAAFGLNCSGFAKWVVDGMLRPLTGRRLPLAPLKQPPLPRGNTFSKPWEALRDPYFGLDWTRNLAAEAGRVFRGERGADPKEYEVKRTAIAALRTSGGSGIISRSYPGYIEDAGFEIRGLKAVLYTLAIDEPGTMYLASVNNEIGTAPRLRQHYHVAVLLPQFDTGGRFSIGVFESAVESKFDSFIKRYPGHAVHLTRIPVESNFDP